MELVRFNPTKNLFSLNSHVNRMFEDFWKPAVKSDEEACLCNWDPAVDIYDNEDKIVLKAELPGVDKKDISIDVKGKVLTLRGERSSDNEVKEDSYYRRERTFGKFERAFNLVAEVDPEKIKADFKDGILKIEIPKPEAPKPKQITIH
ncbi:MAG: Hsp20/alpha crystallin family protein [Desulfobacterales bacterium]|nr:Hsp20/alpha crystallin family protein [Desulfobacterales bacterium]